MRIRIVLSACASAAVLAAAGCGSGSGSTASRTSGSATASSRTTARSTSGALFGPVSGHQVFVSACQVCHSISGHNRPSQQGGDLLHFHSSRAELRQLTAEMPIVHHKLSSAEITAVVDYLAAIEAHSR